MTVFLPADLYPEILQFLSGKHLKTISLVNSAFQRLAQSKLFWRIHFDVARSDHWDFFGTGRGREFCSRAHSLALTSLTGTLSKSPEAFSNFLQSFSQLRHFNIRGIWPELHQPPVPVWGIVIDIICPCIETLSIDGMDDVPLWNVLLRSPVLKHLHLTFTTIREPFTSILDKCLPRITTLTLMHIPLRLESNYPVLLGQIHSVQYLALDTIVPFDRAMTLDYLHMSKPNLREISFNVQFYDLVTDKKLIKAHPQFDLVNLPQFEKLSFTIRFARDDEDWAAWFTWLALQLQRSPSASFKKVDICVIPGIRDRPKGISPFQSPPSVEEFNRLATHSNVNILVLVQTRWYNESYLKKGVKREYENTVKFIKKTASVWYDTGKLEIARVFL
ncbi:hypothetical protein DL96DRAFT_1681446 [Flagelloscypha sp. PMI_526]|nr:hypothetical protein DL96DRAFT_1681446 [Flagelloscypha sp. PMI_526]